MKKMSFTPTKEFKSLLTEISKNARKGRVFEKDGDKNDDSEESTVDAPDTQPSDGQDATEAPQPTPEDAPAPEAATETPESDPKSATGEADVAQAELEKAKAKKDAAEAELEEAGHIKLVSPHGVIALLQMILEPAIKTNQIDSLAKKIVDKLDIEDQEDFASFKDETISFRGIEGFNQLIESMEPFIGSSESETPSEPSPQ